MDISAIFMIMEDINDSSSDTTDLKQSMTQIVLFPKHNDASFDKIVTNNPMLLNQLQQQAHLGAIYNCNFEILLSFISLY